METGANNIFIIVTGDEEPLCEPTHSDSTTMPTIVEDGVITIAHNQLPSIQGGSLTERYHVSKDIYDALQNETADKDNKFITLAEVEQSSIIDDNTISDETTWSSEKIDELISENAGLADHIADKDNPHEVTALQVGAYTKEETDNLILPVATQQQTYNNMRVAAWGDSMIRGVGSLGDINTDRFTVYFNQLSGMQVYNGGIAGETSLQVKTRMQANPDKLGWKTIIWAGRNDVTLNVNPSVTKANLDEMVAMIPHDNFLVIGILYKQSEIIGNANRAIVDDLNAYMASMYPDNFYNPNPILINSYNPNIPQDVLDYNNGVFPSSLGNGDGTHLLSAGQLILARALWNEKKESLSIDQYITSPETIAFALTKPTAIGEAEPNTGKFTKLTVEDLQLSKTADSNFFLSAIRQSGSFIIPSGQLYNYASSIINDSTRESGSGSLYNVGMVIDVTNGSSSQSNIALWARAGGVHIGPLTSGFQYMLGVGGISRFGVAGSVNGDMLVSNKITLNQGTSGQALMEIKATGSGGTSSLEIGNTATGGITWRFRVGGNTSGGTAGSGINEGNLSLYEATANKIALHIAKTSTNIGIHGQTAATAYLHFPASLAAAGNAPIKFTPGPLLTSQEVGAFEANDLRLYYTPAGTRETIAYLSDIVSVAPVTSTVNGLMLATDKVKLDTVATGATANSTDAQLRTRGTHTGTQSGATIAQDANYRFTTDTEKAAWNAKQSAMSIPTDVEMQTGTENTKYITPLRNSSWWTWAKTQAQTFLGSITFGLLAGTTTRIVQVDPTGTLEAVHEVIERKVSDVDITTVVTEAVYNSGNNFTAIILPPSGKIMYEGQIYYNGVYRYEAVADNLVSRLTLS